MSHSIGSPHPDGGSTVDQVRRALVIDPRVAAMRPDRQVNFTRFMHAVLAWTDWDTMLARPTRTALAAKTGLCVRSITNHTRLAIELGYLTVTELGTTARIRAGRCYPAPDPHAAESERAQEFLVAVPAELAAQVTPEPTENGYVSAGQDETCPPSSPVFRPERKSSTSHVVTTATTTRARGSDRHHGRIVTAEKSRASARQSKTTTPQPWRACAEQISAVWRAFPAELTELLAAHDAPRIANAIAAELVHRTVAELAKRITRHWAFWRFKLAAGLVRSPAAIAFRLVRRDFDCPDVRCEDRWHLDLGAACKACELKAKEITATRRAERAGGRTVPITGAHRSPAARTAVKRPYDVPVAAPRPDRCDPNEEFRLARQALRRQLGGAAVRATAGRRAIA